MAVNAKNESRALSELGCSDRLLLGRPSVPALHVPFYEIFNPYVLSARPERKKKEQNRSCVYRTLGPFPCCGCPSKTPFVGSPLASSNPRCEVCLVSGGLYHGIQFVLMSPSSALGC